MKEIRLGTIGSGPIVHSILDAVKVTGGISCGAVYSRSREKGEALAAQYGVGKVYTELEQLLSDPELNFIYVASPNSLHYEQTRQALLHGKNVICEKPFCPRRSQVEELTALAKERHLFLVDATPTAFLPNFRILKEQLPKVGPIRLVLCNYTQYSSRYSQVLAGETPNNFSLEFAGGCIQDINYYNIYLNVALFGRPREIKYFANIYPGMADTSGVALLRYDGFASSCAGSKDARGENFVLIEGEDGYIRVKGGSNGVSELELVTKDGGSTTFNAQDDPDRWLIEVRELTPLLLAGDYDAIYSRLAVTAEVIGSIEEARRDAGILFPGD